MTRRGKTSGLGDCASDLQRLNGGDAASNPSDTRHQEPLQAEVKRRLEDLERRVTNPDPPQQERGRNLTDYEMARWRQYFEASRRPGHRDRARLYDRSGRHRAR